MPKSECEVEPSQRPDEWRGLYKIRQQLPTSDSGFRGESERTGKSGQERDEASLFISRK
jgi:hypothetical protein